MTNGRGELAARKALLIAQADLSRMQVALAAGRVGRHAAVGRSVCLVGIAGACWIGRTRLRGLRFGTMAVTIVCTVELRRGSR